MHLSKNNRQVIILFSASVIGMIFGIVNSAINTNYLHPEAYGNVRYVQNIINFFSSILLLGFFVSGSRLLALSNSEKYSRDIRGAMILVLLSTLFILMLIMGGFSIYAYANADVEMGSLYLASIPVCGNVILLNYINTTAQGDNHISRIAFARSIPPILYFVLATIIFHHFGASSLLMLIMFNGSAVLILGIIIISTKPTLKNVKKTIAILTKENREYGFHVYLGSIAGVSTSYIAGITLGLFCDNNVNVGLYTLALSLSTPLSLLPSIIGTAYFKNFAIQNRIGRNVLIGSIVLTLLSLILFIICVRIFVTLVYPEDYAGVSTYTSYLAISTSFYGLGDMINRFLGAHGQGKQIRNASYACGFIIFIGSIILVYFVGIYGAIITRILGSSSYMLILVIYYKKFINNGHPAGTTK